MIGVGAMIEDATQVRKSELYESLDCMILKMVAQRANQA